MTNNVEAVDSHCHASELWYEPIESMLYQMEAHAIDRAVIIQVSAEYDNAYLLSCLQRYPGRFAGVVLVDHRREDACQELERLVASGAGGIRLGAADRSPGDDPLAIWRTIEALGIPVSVSAIRRASPSVAEADVLGELAGAHRATFPSIPFVLEHQGAHGRDRDDNAVRQRKESFALSRFPNVYMKLGGLGELADRARPFRSTRSFAASIPPYHAMAYEAFGADRLMWGSDYPPVAGREGYLGCLESVRESLRILSQAEREAVFGRTAARVFFTGG